MVRRCGTNKAFDQMAVKHQNYRIPSVFKVATFYLFIFFAPTYHRRFHCGPLFVRNLHVFKRNFVVVQKQANRFDQTFNLIKLQSKQYKKL